MVEALFGLIGSLKKAQKGNVLANKLALMKVIAYYGQMHPSELAIELGVNQSSVTRQVQLLENEGYLVVTADPSDLRSCIIRLTDTGQNKLSELNRIGLGRFSKFVANWDAEEVRTFTRLLLKLEQSKAEIAAREESPVRNLRWHKETK
jgi:DNA-binding MarR family transcriptional regulator